MPIDERIALDRARGLNSLVRFVEIVWPTIAPSSAFVPGWHLDILCEHLEALTRCEIDRLVVAMPPGFGKSLVCSIAWPVWHWLKEPRDDVLSCSVDPGLAKSFARASRALIESKRFQARWGDKLGGARGREVADGAGEYYAAYPDGEDVAVGGVRVSFSIGSRGVGWHVNNVVIDDPLQPTDCGPLACGKVRDYVGGTLRRAAKPGQPYRILIAGQRLSKYDLADYGRERGWPRLVLPLEYDPQRYSLPDSDDRNLRRTGIGKGDLRTMPGELLCPALKDAAEVERLKIESAQYDAQQNQDPREDGDTAFPASKFGCTFRNVPRQGRGVWSWDFRFSDRRGKSLSWVVGQYWWRKDNDSYLVEELRDQVGFDGSVAMLLQGLELHPGPVWIENKANGAAIEQHLRGHVPGMILIEPVGSKADRADATQPYLKHLHLPDVTRSSWIVEWLAEVGTFPRQPDDRVDAMTQYVCRAYIKGQSSGLEALRRGR